MQIRKTFIERQLAGEDYLIPVGEAAKSCSIIALSECAAFIWRLLPEADSDGYIVGKILDEYEIDEETARNDVAEFLGKLREMNII